MALAAPALALQEEERELLEKWVRAHNTPQSLAIQASIVLLAADGISNQAIAGQLGVSRPTVIKWRRRFQEGGSAVLGEVRPGRGRRPSIDGSKIKRIVDATLQTTPRGATHWSCRTMAKAQGVSPATVQRIWDAHGLKPHRVRTFKLSKDPQFVEKLTDIVGLYMNPPEKAVVLCVDEKSQIQALDRTQLPLPMKEGHARTRTHDYDRHGTTTLFAALNLLEGTVTGQCLPRHRHQEFLKFLRKLDREFASDMQLHLIVDNYGTHKHASVQRWLAAHPRFQLHFIPTSASWLNLVERWFSEITTKCIRRGSFPSVKALIHDIEEFLDAYNDDPKPYVWTASVQNIIDKVTKCKAILETPH
jgi:transposase